MCDTQEKYNYPKMWDYQYGYSASHASMRDRTMREQKAQKIIAILNDFSPLSQGLIPAKAGTTVCLDVGCSAGWIANYLSKFFGRVIGMDIDKEAVFYGAGHALNQDGSGHAPNKNVNFLVGDSMRIMLKDASADVVVCAHVYEHVPDRKRLMREIYRVLKPCGICFFAGPNKLWPIEPHHNLPGLCWLPKPAANLYVRAFRKGSHYYENLMTYWQLSRLVSDFEKIDYTARVLQDPEKFMATDMVKPGTLKASIAFALSKTAPWLSPTFVWILRKQK